MTGLRPRVGKIQINPVNLILLKNLRQKPCIHTDKHQIGKLLPGFLKLLPLLQCPKQHTVIHLNSNKIPLRMQTRHIHQKTPFSHANLKKKRSLLPKNTLPLPLKPLRLINHPITLQNSILSPRNIT